MVELLHLFAENGLTKTGCEAEWRTPPGCAMVAPAILAVLVAAPTFAQAPPSLGPAQLDQLAARIALYPDPLLAQILAAATYPNDIPAAGQWRTSADRITAASIIHGIGPQK